MIGLDSDGISVKTEHLPNGSKFSYGRAKNGTVTAITHSTAEGEENSTRKSYTADLVTEVQSGNNTVRYSYDKKQRVTAISLNGTDNYATIAYTGDNTNAQKVTVTLANQPASTVSTCVKDFYGNVIESTCGDAKVVNTPNNTKQRIDKTVEKINNVTTKTIDYQYDDNNNLKSVKQNNAITEQYEYTDDNLIESQNFQNLGYDHTYTYGYGESKNKMLESISVDSDAIVVHPKHDVLGRNTGKVITVSGKNISEEQVSYLKFGDHATNLPATVRYANNVNGNLVFKESLQYCYDCMGNIVEVLENGRSLYRYEYDALGRLTREDNQAFKTTKQYVYDNNGNIIAKYQYPITTTSTNELQWLTAEKSTQYGYATNSDRLMTYGAETFAYDTIGNPTTYRGKTATWKNGRQLTAYNGTTFVYDARGRRTQKNTLTFTYDSRGNLLKQSNGLEFLYDHTGIFAVKQGNSTYYCRKNAQNDVMFLLDKDGTVVVKYRYDAWGHCKVLNASGNEITDANHIGNLNPFRYRSYYYDTETKLYFLQSRYYDPEVGRFITIDDISYLDPDTINGLNLYAYCNNNSINHIDPTGYVWWNPFIAILKINANIKSEIKHRAITLILLYPLCQVVALFLSVAIVGIGTLSAVQSEIVYPILLLQFGVLSPIVGIFF